MTYVWRLAGGWDLVEKSGEPAGPKLAFKAMDTPVETSGLFFASILFTSIIPVPLWLDFHA